LLANQEGITEIGAYRKGGRGKTSEFSKFFSPKKNLRITKRTNETRRMVVVENLNTEQRVF